MNHIQTTLKLLTFATLAVFTVSCATSMNSAENMALKAGFKAITPTTAEHKAILATLPQGKMHELVYHGKTIYVLPDRPNNRAFVGTPAEFQTYKQLRLAGKMSNESMMAPPMNETQTMNWQTWGGFPDWAAESRIP